MTNRGWERQYGLGGEVANSFAREVIILCGVAGAIRNLQLGVADCDNSETVQDRLVQIRKRFGTSPDDLQQMLFDAEPSLGVGLLYGECDSA